MNALDEAIAELELGGNTVTVSALGGVQRILEVEFQSSSALGVVASALSADWENLDDKSAVVDRLAEGLRINRDRLALRECINALQALPKNTYEQFVFALEARTRDANELPLVRVEASAGLIRFALVDPRWRSFACASLLAYRPGSDPHADPMICRLVSLAHDLFGFSEAVALLEDYAEHRTMVGQAKLERGLIEVSRALSSSSIEEIETKLIEAEKWLKAAVHADEERHDSRSYHLLIKSILYLQKNEQSELKSLVNRLRKEAFISDLWSRSAPGMEWLIAPSYSFAAWVPVVESLAKIVQKIDKPSWLDASRVLEHVFHLYSINRSVRLGSPDLGRYFKPVIEAAFVRERGLAAHLQQWLESAPNSHISRQDAERLSHNIARYLDEEDPPKKN